jgi:hypothetical protein
MLVNVDFIAHASEKSCDAQATPSAASVTRTELPLLDA